MKRCFFLLLFSLFASPLFSQTFTVPWKGTKVIDYGYEKFTVPFIKGEGFSYDGSGIWYSITQDYSGTEKGATDMVWEPVAATALHDVRALDLPVNDIYHAGVFNEVPSGQQKITVAVAALKQEGNRTYRLVSFTLKDLPGAESARTVNKLIGTTENPLKSGTFYKIKVDKSGIFKITTQFLRENGINPSGIEPRNFRVYGNGGLMLPEHNRDFRFAALQQDAIQVIGEADGKWDNDDYALFYAQGPNGFNVYSNVSGTENRRFETRSDTSSNFINIYEDFAYYFINFDIGPGKRISDDNEPVGGTEITRYDEYQYINEEKYNLMKIGRVWTGESFNDSKNVKFTTRTPLLSTDVVRYRSRVFGFQSQGNALKSTFNGQNPSVKTINSNDKLSVAQLVYNGTVSGLQGTELSFDFVADRASNPNGQFFFDYAEVQYKQDLKFNGKQFNFRSYDIREASGETYTFSVSDATAIEQIWDVSDITNVRRKLNQTTGSNIFKFAYTADDPIFQNEFVAFKNNETFSPAFVGKVANQDLAALQNIDYLMITAPEMLGQAQRLAAMHKENYRVAVVDVNQIYNEFSSGGKDITAIRDFVTRLDTTAGELQFVFLLGDTSYDFKGKNHPGSDIIPSYQSEESGSFSSSFVTDDYYVMTAPQLSTQTKIWAMLPNVPIGRLPAANLSEAKLLIDKTLAYNNALPGQATPFGEWRMKLDFVADDDFDNGVPFHNTMNAVIVNVFEQNKRNEYNVRKLYLDAFPAQTTAGGQKYPDVNQAISNDMGNTLYLFYFGHGGINGWAQERVLTIDMIRNFYNFNNVFARFPLVSTITCEFTLWDDPATFSAGEQVIKLKEGGAATMITSSRAIGVSYGEQFTTIFTKHIFELVNGDFVSLGDALLLARREKGIAQDHLRVNFLGDPAMKLSRPKQLIQVDEINSPVEGTIRALDFIKISGHIRNAAGQLDTSFNGRIAAHVFDKKHTRTTLNNDGAAGLLPLLEYKEEGNPIVKSSGTVKDGKFTVEFYVPKDINYEMGTGRIMLYADNKVFDVFSNQPYKIGGINPAGIDDKEPPKIRLYMNNSNFADGGITDQNPTLLACVTDNTGINSTGSGIGHDVTVVLDGKIIDTVPLNDFYFSGDGNGCTNPDLPDYQKGNVTYPFRNLAPGEHQLTFKVWDINNNSSTETLNFIVKSEADQNLIVNKLLNWPNPFTDKTYVHFEHNCDDILEVNVQIYTITGKLVKTISTMVSAEPFFQGYRTPKTAIEWDGTDDFGQTVGKGTYIYKIFARSQNQEKCRGSATGVEKMVLLK